ncbi:hypothetical protein CFP56_035326 [Quercus suber]|uniref:Uncharacterized protein n=1 Tax=Quercus suber TaxID=58331 RepID=A0AAW0JAN8_QUESU
MAILSHTGVNITRLLCEDFVSANHLERYSLVCEEAKNSMAFWLERLPSRPSHGGNDHWFIEVVVRF